MSDSSPFKEEPLTIRDHEAPEKHYIGEALPKPSPADMFQVGGIGAVRVGEAVAPARADHGHMLRGTSFYVRGDTTTTADNAPTKVDWYADPTSMKGESDFRSGAGAPTAIKPGTEGVYVMGCYWSGTSLPVNCLVDVSILLNGAVIARDRGIFNANTGIGTGVPSGCPHAMHWMDGAFGADVIELQFYNAIAAGGTAEQFAWRFWMFLIDEGPLQNIVV